jgi:hypothetical protein
VPHLETRAILAGAYRGRSVSDRPMRTHVALVLDDDTVSRTLCNRVDRDSLADAGATPTDPNLATCPTCARKLRHAKWPQRR